MSREKQNSGSCKICNSHIEEMANFLWKNTLIHTEDLCHDVSETLYNADYRKQNENTVEVVRCKDCKYANLVRSCNKYMCEKGCGTLKYSTDFCSYGEAKMKGGAE